MGSSEVWDEETAERYDATSSAMFRPEILDPTVDFLAHLAGEGSALEFAIGTGRVGIPLAARGISVTGIELSPAMVAELRKKTHARGLEIYVGDMATTVVKGAGSFDVVYLVWNSISNLRTQQEQVECFRNAARHLKPGGRFVIELWVPQVRQLSSGQRALPISLGPRHLIFDTYDLLNQRCVSHHYYGEGEGLARYTSGEFRYIWPSECDLMAQLAQMELEDRFADWSRRPFTADSGSHVSVWRKPF